MCQIRNIICDEDKMDLQDLKIHANRNRCLDIESYVYELLI